MEINSQEDNSNFTFVGMSIEKLSISFGIFLILWGFVISFISSSNSFTSYIPSMLGLPVLIFSYLSLKFTKRKKLFMHIVVIFALIIFLGGFDFVRQILNGNVFINLWADVSKIMMLLSGAIFLYACIKSFRFERQKKF